MRVERVDEGLEEVYGQMMFCSKSSLAIALSELKGFEKPKVMLEQYPTDSEIAADVLWQAFLKGDLQKVSVDLGCGTGLLGIGALLLGAPAVVFVDVDEDALKTAKENLEFVEKKYGITLKKKARFICSDIKNIDEKFELVLQNPPFGVQKEHADRAFLERAFEIAPIVYSFHKIESKEFLEQFAKDKGFKITDAWVFDFPLKASMEFHRRKIERIKVGCWRLEKTEK